MAKMEIASKTESKGECFVTKESECKQRSNAYRSLRPKQQLRKKQQQLLFYPEIKIRPKKNHDNAHGPFPSIKNTSYL